MLKTCLQIKILFETIFILNWQEISKRNIKKCKLLIRESKIKIPKMIKVYIKV